MNEEWQDKNLLTTKSSGARFRDNTNHLTTIQGMITAPQTYKHQSSFSIPNCKRTASFRETKKIHFLMLFQVRFLWLARWLWHCWRPSRLLHLPVCYL